MVGRVARSPTLLRLGRIHGRNNSTKPGGPPPVFKRRPPFDRLQNILKRDSLKLARLVAEAKLDSPNAKPSTQPYPPSNPLPNPHLARPPSGQGGGTHTPTQAGHFDRPRKGSWKDLVLGWRNGSYQRPYTRTELEASPGGAPGPQESGTTSTDTGRRPPLRENGFFPHQPTRPWSGAGATAVPGPQGSGAAPFGWNLPPNLYRRPPFQSYQNIRVPNGSGFRHPQLSNGRARLPLSGGRATPSSFNFDGRWNPNRTARPIRHPHDASQRFYENKNPGEKKPWQRPAAQRTHSHAEIMRLKLARDTASFRRNMMQMKNKDSDATDAPEPIVIQKPRVATLPALRRMLDPNAPFSQVTFLPLASSTPDILSPNLSKQVDMDLLRMTEIMPEGLTATQLAGHVLTRNAMVSMEEKTKALRRIARLVGQASQGPAVSQRQKIL